MYIYICMYIHIYIYIYIHIYIINNWGFLFYRRQHRRGKDEDHVLFLSTTSTRSRTFRHLFETLHVRLLPSIFNRIPCN